MRAPKSATPSGASRGRFTGWAIGVFVLALAVRWLHLWQLRATPFFGLKIGDALSYDGWARSLAGGDWIGSEVFYQAPLYPYFLGVLYALVGDDPLRILALQSVLGSLACALLAGAGRRLFSPAVGVLAGVVLAVQPAAVFFDGIFQKSVLGGLLVALTLWVAAGLVGPRARARGWTGLGLVLGALMLTRENAVVFAGVALVWAAILGARRAGLERIVPAGLLAAGLAAVLLPVAVRNFVVGGELHLTTSQLGPNFYIGNNDEATGWYSALRVARGDALYEREDATEIAELLSGRSLTPGEVSAFWTRRALEFITSQPVSWLRLMGKKFTLTWNATEIADTEDVYTTAEWSAPLRVTLPIAHLGVLAPLAVLGVFASWRRRAELWPLMVMPVVYAFSVTLFYVFARYRYPLVPFLALFGAAGVVGLPRLMRESSTPRRLGCVAAVIGTAVFCNWPAVSEVERDRMLAAALANQGLALEGDGQLEQAASVHRRALALEPDNLLALNNLGNVLMRQGERDEAIALYRRVLELAPNYSGARHNLGVALRLQGKLGDAHRELGIARTADREFEEAARHFRRAIQEQPDDAGLHLKLAGVLRVLGDHSGALEHYRRALELEPDSPEALRLTARMLATHPDAASRDPLAAVSLAERAVAMEGKRRTAALDTLAAAYAAAGRFDDAARVAREALERARGRGTRQADQIRERLALYERGLPYVEPR